MNKDDCFQLGYIAKLHGFKGEVSLFLDVSDPQDYYKIKTVFIELNNLLIPFSVESIKIKNKGFIAVKFVEISNEEEAKKLLKKTVFLPDTYLPKLYGTHFYDHEIIGFSVEDIKHGYIGKVVQVLDLPANPLIEVKKDNTEILLPLQDGLVQQIDRNNKCLYVKSPPGLVDLYLG